MARRRSNTPRWRKRDSLLPSIQNDSVDACRKMAFDHFAGTKQ